VNPKGKLADRKICGHCLQIEYFELSSEYTNHNWISNKFVACKSMKCAIYIGQISLQFMGMLVWLYMYPVMFTDLLSALCLLLQWDLHLISIFIPNLIISSPVIYLQ
jgi:hypothetical protein